MGAEGSRSGPRVLKVSGEGVAEAIGACAGRRRDKGSHLSI